MAIPYKHSEASTKKWGGKPEDYIDIHELLDSTKATFADNRHRTLTHNSWFLVTILPKIFGHVRTNSDGKQYNVKDVGEQHVLEDFGMQFIPTVQDYLQEMEIQAWMSSGGKYKPNSALKEKKAVEPVIIKTISPHFTHPPFTVLD